MKKIILAAAACIALAGAAHAQSASDICGPAFTSNPADWSGVDCWVRVMAEKVQAGQPLTAGECTLLGAMKGHADSCDQADAARPEEQARRAAVRATQHGPKEIPLR